jgi:hypothetical protein
MDLEGFDLFDLPQPYGAPHTTTADVDRNPAPRAVGQHLISDFRDLDPFDFPPLPHSTTQPTTSAHVDLNQALSSLPTPLVEVPLSLPNPPHDAMIWKYSHSNSFGLYNGINVVPALKRGASLNINSDAPPIKTNPIPNLFPGNDQEMGVGQGSLNAQIPMNVDSLPLEVGISEVRSLPFPVHSSPATFVSHQQSSFDAQAPMSFDIVGSTDLPFPRSSTGLFGGFDSSSQHVSQNSKDFWIPFNSVPVTDRPTNSIMELDNNECEIATNSGNLTLSHSQNPDTSDTQAIAVPSMNIEVSLAQVSSTAAGNESQGYFMSVFHLRPDPEKSGDLTAGVKRYFIHHRPLIRDRKRGVLKKIEKGNNRSGRTGALRCEPCRKRKIKVRTHYFLSWELLTCS